MFKSSINLSSIFRVFISILALYYLLSGSCAEAQSPASEVNSPAQMPKVGWYFAPSYSMMLHGDHIGNAIGVEAGASFWKRRLQVGFFYLGRSGPINPQAYTLSLPEGTDYKGQAEVQVRADHGAFGLVINAMIPLAKHKLNLEIPMMVGQMGAGFYLFGEDRETPDGRRVSEWENELMGDSDAGFGILLEAGLRLSYNLPKVPGMAVGAGIHFTTNPGWESFVGGTDFYNIPRISLFVRFGN